MPYDDDRWRSTAPTYREYLRFILPAVAVLVLLAFEITAKTSVLSGDPPIGLLLLFLLGFPAPLALFLAVSKSRNRALVGIGYLVAETVCLYVTYSSDDELPGVALFWWVLLLGGALAVIRAVERDGFSRAKKR
ncbi:MAG: hypothetical protein QOF21_1364 [Actinomycetota bacterium]